MKEVGGLLGLCARAGRIVTGEGAALEAIRSGRAMVALLDGGASANARKAVADAAAHYGVDLYILPAGILGDSVGRPNRMAAAVTDRGFSDKLRILLTTDERGGALRE